jgi:hypothetical protein
MNPSLSVKNWRFFAYTLLFLSILRGIRFPNLWSYSHFLFNYDSGFTKRGLIGEIFSQFNSNYLISYDFFFIFSMTVFFINIFLLITLIRKMANSNEPIIIGCMLVFSSSLAIVFLSHSIGYFDQIGLMIALIALKITGFYKKLQFLLPSMLLLSLIHEAAVIIFFPVIFMSLLFSIKAENEDFIKKATALILFSLGLIALELFVTGSTLTATEAHNMHNNLHLKVNHTLRLDAFDVLHRNSNDNFEIMKKVWSEKNKFIQLLDSWLVTAPVFMVFIYFSVVILLRSKTGFFIILLSVLASLSPLLLHFFGWDINRWNTLTITTSFLMLYTAYTYNYKNLIISSGHYSYLLFYILIFFNGTSSIGLFDGYSVKQFPFIEHQNYIYSVFNRTERFPYIPPQW